MSVNQQSPAAFRHPEKKAKEPEGERASGSCAWARARLAQSAPSCGAVLTDFSLPGRVPSHLVKPGRRNFRKLSGSLFWRVSGGAVRRVDTQEDLLCASRSPRFTFATGPFQRLRPSILWAMLLSWARAQ